MVLRPHVLDDNLDCGCLRDAMAEANDILQYNHHCNLQDNCQGR